MNCRHCEQLLQHVFLDLGFAPPSNSYLGAADLRGPETWFPLKLYVCEHCWLVQTEDYSRADELFGADYAYFSSVSRSWMDHAARYVDMVQRRFALDETSHVIEVASNDGYLLKNLVAAGIPCLGIEPTASTAAAAEAIGVPVRREFFGLRCAENLVAEGKSADLVLGNNVYAHVPDINDFTAGLCAVLKQGGTITLEFPHLMSLLRETQFDTVYHEHYSYLSLWTVQSIFKRAGLRVWDVERLPTHGGSLRIYGCHADDPRGTTSAVAELLHEEGQQGLRSLETYRRFQSRVDGVKNDFLSFLIEQKNAGRKVVAYGAAAKGNTLLNYAGVKPDLLPFVCDAAPSKQGKYLPGSHIPILPPAALVDARPDVVLVLPWNIAREICEQLDFMRARGARFAIAVPALQFLP